MAHATAPERVPLRHVAQQPVFARLRELRGSDELALQGVDTRAAVQLLDRLLSCPPGALSLTTSPLWGEGWGRSGAFEPHAASPRSGLGLQAQTRPAREGRPRQCAAADLSASDRDALLAALHRAAWGDRITSSLRCPACGEMVDLSFELSALQRQLQPKPTAVHVDGLRALRNAQGEAYALPDASTEEAAATLGLHAGLASLQASIAGADAPDAAALGTTLEALAPLLDVELDAACAECGASQLVRFDIQSFTLQRLLDERERLLGEVHALAGGYGWSLDEIVSLPRSLRRALAARLAAVPPAFG